jgi:hypothetical protein
MSVSVVEKRVIGAENVPRVEATADLDLKAEVDPHIIHKETKRVCMQRWTSSLIFCPKLWQTLPDHRLENAGDPRSDDVLVINRIVGMDPIHGPGKTAKPEIPTNLGISLDPHSDNSRDRTQKRDIQKTTSDGGN